MMNLSPSDGYRISERGWGGGGESGKLLTTKIMYTRTFFPSLWSGDGEGGGGGGCPDPKVPPPPTHTPENLPLSTIACLQGPCNLDVYNYILVVEFDRFLAERAREADGLPDANTAQRSNQRRMQKDDQENALFAL